MQESFLQITLQEFPKLNFAQVVADWMADKSVQFTDRLIISPNYQFSDTRGHNLKLLTKLFEQVKQPISYEEIDELVLGYVNCDVFIDFHIQKKPDKKMVLWYNHLSENQKRQLSKMISNELKFF